jgi:hypothetical protein
MGQREAIRPPKKLQQAMPPSAEIALQRERTRRGSQQLEAGQCEAIVSRFPWRAINAVTEGAYGRMKRCVPLALLHG